MVVNGINVILKDFCSYCPNFEATCKKIDVSTAIDSSPRVVTEITCENMNLCENLKKRLTEK